MGVDIAVVEMVNVELTCDYESCKNWDSFDVYLHEEYDDVIKSKGWDVDEDKGIALCLKHSNKASFISELDKTVK